MADENKTATLESAEELYRKICSPAPFDNDDQAVQERDGCDYSVKITMDMAR